ncbi:MAG: hypothetical protein HKN58_04675, partial [Xanthomonadales bacterium]|nr:hypothetical protein [Xanthomonadales bacterium]
LVIDCHIDREGEILLFEANATANPLQDSPSSTRENDRLIRRMVSELIHRRLNSH